MRETQTHSQFVDPARSAGMTHVEKSLVEPAVTAIVPMMA
jgi:hypothetical protein